MSLASPDRRLSEPFLADLEEQGSGAVGGGCSEMGLQSSLCLSSSTVPSSNSSSELFAHIHQGEIESLISKGAVEPAPLSPGFYSRLFIVQKASGAWRPRAYAFPPFALVREVINKVVLSRNLLLTLVAPWWPQKEWFLDLQSLTIAAPVSLPMCRDLLHQPHFHRLHLRIHVLRLHTWRLSSGSHEN